MRPPRQEWSAGNLPLSLTGLIGRENDLDEIDRAIDCHRLVTLIGTGGVGKTRLALEVGRRRQHRHRDGAWLVDLSSLVDETVVAHAIAAIFGIPEQPNHPLLDSVVDALQRRDLLIVVDNCEHLLDASARTIDLLVRRCPRVSVLATSRERLGIDGEVAWPVSPLAMPPVEESICRSDLVALPPVRLFIERAGSARHGFTLTDQGAHTVAQICRRLDGLPLAIELAAARVPTLTVEQIADRLDDRFQLLTSGRRTSPPRHQALQAALDWSFDLVSEPERIVVRRVAVFVNGWTLEAAEQVVGGPWTVPGLETDRADRAAPETSISRAGDIPPADILEHLARLVAQSLVQVEHVEGANGQPATARYHLLETVRQYAWKQLEEAGEVEVARRRHASWCAFLARQAEPHLLGHEQVAWVVRLDQEQANIRAAVSWCTDHAPALGLDLAAAIWQFWRIRLHLSEGRRVLDLLLTRAPLPCLARARALAGAGVLAHWQLDAVQARERLEESAQLARSLGDQQVMGRVLRDLGTVMAARFGDRRKAWVLYEQGLAASHAAHDVRSVASNLQQQGRLAAVEGDYPRAQQLLDESVRLLVEVGDPWQLAIVLEDAGGVALVVGQPERATALLEQSLATSKALEVAGIRTMHRRYHLGSVAYWRGDVASAITWYEDGLALTRENEHVAGIADNLTGLGRAVLLQGDLSRATTLLSESLELCTERGDRSGTAAALHGLGMAARVAGDMALAARYLCDSLSLRHQLNERLGVAGCLDGLSGVGVSRATSVDEARRAIRWLGAADALHEVLGTPRPPVDRLSRDATIAAADLWLDDVAAELLAGSRLPLDAIVATALAHGPSDSPSAETTPAPKRAVGPASGARSPVPGSRRGAARGGPFPSGLSTREVEVLRLIASGHTNAEIAEILSVSPNTIRHHVTHILDKTGCENRAAATAFAFRHDLA